MRKINAHTKRWNKNFLLHSMRRIRWEKSRHPKAVVQLNVICGEVCYDTPPLQSSDMFDYEVDYMNQFHKENNQSLIWVTQIQYKCEKRKKMLKKTLTD